MANQKVLRGIGIRVNRRTALRGMGAGVFGSAMALSIGRAPKAYAASCTGPYGSGHCYSGNCSGSRCKNDSYGVNCSQVSGFCGGGACWTSGGGTCCDCRCTDSNRLFYCYCYG